MQRTIFQCDECKAETSAKGAHVSLRLSINSGIARPPKSERNQAGHWVVNPDMNGKFIHFCDEKCLAKHFKKLISQKQPK